MAKRGLHRSTKRNRSESVAHYGSRTDIGCVREQNEDSLIVSAPLFVVADGMGGHAAGEVASEICVRTIEECAPRHADADKLGESVEQANRDVISAALANKGRKGMGTTCTAAILEEDRLAIAQVGDSRAYLLHAGKLTQITRDHSLMADMIEAGRITPEEARVHPNRSVITRALGNDPDMTPDLYEINVESGDKLMLCSDGLTSMVDDETIESIMNKFSDPQRCASALVDEAISAGGADNVTVVIANATGLEGKRRKRNQRRTIFTVALILLLFIGALAAAAWGGSAYLHNTAYLTEEDGKVAIYRGVPGDVLGFSYSELVTVSNIKVDDLPPSAAERIREGMRVTSVDEAEELLESYRTDLEAKSKEATTA